MFKKHQKGSALLVSILLMAMISTASFGIARLALIELDAGQIQSANLSTYYLAEGGMEEGLLRWRYDHSATLINDGIETGSRQDAMIWQKVRLSNREKLTGAISTSKSDELTASNTKTDEYIALTMYNQVTGVHPSWLDQATIERDFHDNALSSVDYFTRYLSDRPDLLISKDNKAIIGFYNKILASGGGDPADDVMLYWRWQKLGLESAVTDWSSSYSKSYGVEVRLYQKNISGSDILLSKRVYSPPGANQISGANISQCSGRSCSVRILADLNQTALNVNRDTYLSITPIGASIILAGVPIKSAGGISGEVVDNITHIESIGVFAGRMRKLSMSIEQSSGRILGLYDFVLYQGSK